MARTRKRQKIRMREHERANDSYQFFIDDPREWTTEQVQSWLRSTTKQFKMQQIPNMETLFPENGQELSHLTEDEFVQRCPQAGITLHGQLEVWKVSCADETFISTINDDQQSQYSSMSIDDPSDIIMTPIKTESDETSHLVVTPPSPSSITSSSTTSSSSSTAATTTPTTITNLSTTSPTVNVTTLSGTTINGASIVKTTSSPTTTTKVSRHGSAHIHLWQFLKELLGQPQTYGTALRWIDRKQGIFKIEDSVRVARLWGRRKNRPAMNYDKLSRSIRQYYKKGIMKKTERSQRLVYQFCHPYFL